MSRRRGNIQVRSPGSYRLRYSLGRDPIGKRRIATTTVRGTRKDAERELTRLLRTADAGEHVDPSRMTVPADIFSKRLPKIERKELTTLTVEQSAHLLESIKYTHIYWPVLIALATGMRRGEIF